MPGVLERKASVTYIANCSRSLHKLSLIFKRVDLLLRLAQNFRILCAGSQLLCPLLHRVSAFVSFARQPRTVACPSCWQVFYERTFLVGVDQRGAASQGWTVADSLEELAQLADTAGLRVVGTTHQKLDHPNPKTYVGSGKINEIARAVEASGAETVVFDGTSLFRPLSSSILLVSLLM